LRGKTKGAFWAKRKGGKVLEEKEGSDIGTNRTADPEGTITNLKKRGLVCRVRQTIGRFS